MEREKADRFVRAVLKLYQREGQFLISCPEDTDEDCNQVRLSFESLGCTVSNVYIGGRLAFDVSCP